VKNLDPKTYLETLFDAVLFKDVVKRYKIRLSQKIYDLVLYLISNFSGEFSFTKLKKFWVFECQYY
jgi:predicted AAA+ superfamily ATPase